MKHDVGTIPSAHSGSQKYQDFSAISAVGIIKRSKPFSDNNEVEDAVVG